MSYEVVEETTRSLSDYVLGVCHGLAFSAALVAICYLYKVW